VVVGGWWGGREGLHATQDLFGTFNVTFLRHVNSGGEAVVSSTAVAFIRTLKNLAKNGDPSFVISPGFGRTKTSTPSSPAWRNTSPP